MLEQLKFRVWPALQLIIFLLPNTKHITRIYQRIVQIATYCCNIGIYDCIFTDLHTECPQTIDC